MSILDSPIRTVSIIGCGWTGLALAEALIADGMTVKGSVTTEHKCQTLRLRGILPYQIRFSPEPDGPGDLADLLATDVVVISLPPMRKADDLESFHATQIQRLCQAILAARVPYVLYLSSTSVYPEQYQIATEDSPLVQDFSPVVLAETVLRQQAGFETTILRLGGLMGYDRIPGKTLAGKSTATGNMPVNFVHRDDVIAAIGQIITEGHWGKTYNLVAPAHPTRKQVYEQAAAKWHFAMPVFEGESPWKLVTSDLIVRDLRFTFKYPDPLAFAYRKG